MIVVVGVPAWRAVEPAGPAGRAAMIALAAAERGSRVEVVGRIGDDPIGDALVLALGRAGVGHAATLRDPARPTPVIVPPAEETAPTAPEGDRSGPDGLQAPSPVALVDAVGLDAADVSLGLRYLTDFSVLVLTDDVPAPAYPVVVEAAAFASAHLVVLVPTGGPVPDWLPADATALAVPEGEDEGAFAALVGTYAAALDAGVTPAEAFSAAANSAGWEALDAAGGASGVQA